MPLCKHWTVGSTESKENTGGCNKVLEDVQYYRLWPLGVHHRPKQE
jgi:hypothetical protein